MKQEETLYTLLALCARAQGYPAQKQLLRHQANLVSDWSTVLVLAEHHGLSPLVYAHLQDAAISLPENIQQQLQARAMQHAHANQVRSKVLADVLRAFNAAGIDALVLKGAALSHLVYPRPGLRSMRDIDVLVSRSQVWQAQRLLADLGFNAPLPADGLPAKHLPVAQRRAEDILVSLEIHHNLYADGTAVTELEALRRAAIPFTIGDTVGHTLGYDAMLEHVYRHANNIFNPLRLIWIADLVSWAERFAGEINWRRVHPAIRNALALPPWLPPRIEESLGAVAFSHRRSPHGIGQEFQGWPRYSMAAQREKGIWGTFQDTFFPSVWWLRFYYGLPAGFAVWWGRFVRHPLHMLGWIRHYLRQRQ